jgi:hypothetical protein
VSTAVTQEIRTIITVIAVHQLELFLLMEKETCIPIGKYMPAFQLGLFAIVYVLFIYGSYTSVNPELINFTHNTIYRFNNPRADKCNGHQINYNIKIKKVIKFKSVHLSAINIWSHVRLFNKEPFFQNLFKTI